jgi:hypothetical protein
MSARPKPISGRRTKAELGPLLVDVWLVLWLPYIAWKYVSDDGVDWFDAILLTVIVVVWPIVFAIATTQWVPRLRLKAGSSGVVLLYAGQTPRAVRTRLRRSLGLDIGSARQATKQPAVLIACDLDDAQAQALAAQLTRVGAATRVVHREEPQAKVPN